MVEKQVKNWEELVEKEAKIVFEKHGALSQAFLMRKFRLSAAGATRLLDKIVKVESSR